MHPCGLRSGLFLTVQQIIVGDRLCIATLRRHRDGHMYASKAQEMFSIIDRLEPMIKNSIKQRESNQLTFANV